MNDEALPSVTFAELIRMAQAGESTSYEGDCAVCRHVTTWRLIAQAFGQKFYKCDGCGEVQAEAVKR